MGKAISIAPLDQRFTTQQAADFLGISRPTLIKLLEEDKIPFEPLPGGQHRQVYLSDVLEYQKRMSTEQKNMHR